MAVKKTRRLAEPSGNLKADLFVWEIIHWFTMTILRHRIVRGYSLDDGRLMYIYWDKSENWSAEGEDWHRLNVPYPEPIWRRSNEHIN